MPKIEAALYSYLVTEPTVSALVADRVYPFRLPEGTALPAIAYQRISAQRTYTFDAFGTPAWTRARIQFSCWGSTALQAIEVGEALLLSLSGYEGDMSGELIGSAMAEFELDDYQSEDRLYRRLLDVFISYEDDAYAS